MQAPPTEPHGEVLVADPLLLGPASLFVAATAYAAALAATEPGLPGEPFGVHVPGPVRTHLALGLGSATSAPWPMAAVAIWAAVRGGPGRGSDVSARAVAGVGAALIAGTLAEPVTWGRRPASAMARATIPMHLAVGAALMWAGTHRLRHQAGTRPDDPEASR